ncbi:MAG: hypothetical protein GF387_02975 [Candidatus Portnoybacteria bacterium]|nr:hypothetical protein [Candidatus Portnoybacteria bacterium]
MLKELYLLVHANTKVYKSATITRITKTQYTKSATKMLSMAVAIIIPTENSMHAKPKKIPK